MSNIFFGIGHGYGGTHLLAKLLNLPNDVDCQHERRDGYSRFSLFDKYRSVYAGLESDNVAYEERRHMISKTLNDGYRFGEINGILTFFASALHKHYPDAKFVYLTRNPMRQIVSMFNSGTYDEQIFLRIKKVPFWMLPKSVITKDAETNICERLENEPTEQQWGKMTKLQKCAWSWKLVNDEALRQLDSIPKEKVFIYKFEEMIRGARLEELFKFLDLELPSFEDVIKLVNIKHNKTPVRVKRPIPPWERLSKQKKNLILTITWPTRRRLKYG